MWSSKEFDDWCKSQVQKFKERGIRTSTSGVTRMLHEKIILPSNLELPSIVFKEKPVNIKVDVVILKGRQKKV